MEALRRGLSALKERVSALAIRLGSNEGLDRGQGGTLRDHEMRLRALEGEMPKKMEYMDAE